MSSIKEEQRRSAGYGPIGPLLAEARTLDAEDPLRQFKARFFVPEGRYYLDGNSLGLMSVDAEERMLRAVAEWKTLGIDGWLKADPPWFEHGERLGAAMADLVGAEPAEVSMTGTTTINLHQLALTFLKNAPRKNVLADSLNFPSDLYALAADAKLSGGRLRLVDSRDGKTLDEQAIIDAMTPDVGLAILPSVLYRSGQLLDIERLAEAARDRGIVLGFDCCHSAGVVPHRFDEWGVDFAFWCTYKYMNGGPGAPAALYVNSRHWALDPALPGWWGHRKDTQFEMHTSFEKAGSAGAWQISTPTIIGAAALWGALGIIHEAEIHRMREKSLKQTSYLMNLIDTELVPLGFAVGTPREASRRGGHVALEHEDAWRICTSIKRRGVIPDFRPENVIRLAPSPLYTSFQDMLEAVQIIKASTEQGEHLGLPRERRGVT